MHLLPLLPHRPGGDLPRVSIRVRVLVPGPGLRLKGTESCLWGPVIGGSPSTHAVWETYLALGTTARHLVAPVLGPEVGRGKVGGEEIAGRSVGWAPGGCGLCLEVRRASTHEGFGTTAHGGMEALRQGAVDVVGADIVEMVQTAREKVNIVEAFLETEIRREGAVALVLAIQNNDLVRLTILHVTDMVRYSGGE